MRHTGERESTTLWDHLYETCEPNFCVWCEASQEFVRWVDVAAGYGGARDE